MWCKTITNWPARKIENDNEGCNARKPTNKMEGLEKMRA